MIVFGVNTNKKINKFLFVEFAFLTTVCIFFTGLIILNLGKTALDPWDESIYAQVASESKNPLVFTWLGNYPHSNWFEKPPLLIWLTQLSFKVFGQSEFSARIVPALFALVTIALTYFFVRDIFKDRVAAAIAASIFFIMFQFLLYSPLLNYDVPVGFFILCGAWALYKIESNQKYWYGFAVATALGVLTKSIIGLLPVLILSINSLFKLNFGYLKDGTFWKAVLLFFVIVSPWHIYESFAFGKAFWNSYLFYHVLSRYIKPLENNGGSNFLYFDIFKPPLMLFLCSTAGLFFLFASVKKFDARPYRFVLLAAVILFSFFSFSATKSYAYILPVFPFLASAIGVTMSDLINMVPYTYLKKIALFAFCVTCFLFAIFTNKYRLIRSTSLNIEEAKLVGRLIQSEYQNSTVSYVPINTTSRIVNQLPELIFYSGKPIALITNLPNTQLKSVKRLATIQLYTGLDDNLYIVSTRQIQ